MSRRPLVAGNFKLHFVRADVRAWAAAMTATPLPDSVDVWAAASHPLVETLANALAGSPVSAGAQDVSEMARGAFTGDVSAEQLLDVGARFTLVGHSERRAARGDDDARVAAKVARAREAGLPVVLCVGETLAERDAGRTQDVVIGQLDAALPALGPSPTFVLAYEPVWAIGTGRTATPADAQSVHAALRTRLERHEVGLGRSTRILYGGSVKAENAAELLGQPDVDGALVGGAALDAATFLRIVRAAAAGPQG